MAHRDLRSFLNALEAAGQLVRVQEEVDPDQEVTIIQHRVLDANGPALLFENVKGSPYRMATNLFGTPARVELAFGGPPARIGEQVSELAHHMMPPSPAAAWQSRKTLWQLVRTGLHSVRSGPVMDCEDAPPDLMQLPCLTCWPLDGGPFFTLPLVHTVDPVSGVANLGIYRMQRYDQTSTGMHWQIEKGGGFHFARACDHGEPLKLSVSLGGPPALTLAAIAPLPEGIDERLLASLILGQPLDVINRPSGHRVPAQAEFILEGTVAPDERRKEGPFGDHLGHYSHSAEFPVFRVDRVLHRRDAIYPATVVGKPPQEDYYIGEALQEMTLPLLKLIKPGIHNLWAYPETGFHPLAVAAVHERYQHEGLKHACALLGEGQMSLTKVLIVVDDDVDVRRFAEVSDAIQRNFDPATGLHLLAPTAQDTLDFTGPSMNMGSRLILLATRQKSGPVRPAPPGALPRTADLHKQVTGVNRIGRGVLVVQVADGADTRDIRAALHRHPVAQHYTFMVLVSQDVPMDDERLMLWGWFTRFDPLQDLHPHKRTLDGNRLIFDAPLCIDATWKKGYRKPVAFDPEKERAVDRKWDKLGIAL